jgi:hypothetical protein
MVRNGSQHHFRARSPARTPSRLGGGATLINATPARLFAGAIVELLAVVLAGRIECLCRGPRPDLRQIKTCEAA